MQQAVRLSSSELARQLCKQLDAAGKAELIVTGYSMTPMLRNCRDSVILEPVSQPLQTGDVIFFQRENGSCVLHRIISQTAEGFLCCGDHQWQSEQVRPTQVMAVVTAFYRGGKLRSCSNASYLVYTRLCVALFPVRRPLLFIRKLAGKLRRKLRSLLA